MTIERNLFISEEKWIEDSMALLQKFRNEAYTSGLDHEFESILKFYKARLYDLKRTKNDY